METIYQHQPPDDALAANPAVASLLQSSVIVSRLAGI
jgi:hypothetical protein